MKIFALIFLISSAAASATTIEGTINRSGIGRNMKVSLVKDETLVPLCLTSVSKAMSYIQRARVKAEGVNNPQAKCFNVEKFDILNLPNGNRAVTGKFVQMGKKYYLQTPVEKFFIQYPTKGLLELLGSKVVVDIYWVNTTAGETSYRIGSYLEYPEIEIEKSRRN